MRTLILLAALALVALVPSVSQAGDHFAPRIAFTADGTPILLDVPVRLPRDVFHAPRFRFPLAPRLALIPARDVFRGQHGRVFVPVVPTRGLSLRLGW